MIPEPSGHPPSGWHAYRPAATAQLPAWAVEIALTIERPAPPDPEGVGGEPQAMLLLRAPARASGVVSALIRAAAEIEAAAGMGSASGLRLVEAQTLPGLAPITTAAALAQLGAAGMRGLPPPARRRQPATGTVETWRSSPGSVLTCESSGGTSAQAVIAVRGLGDVDAIAPPPGGAVVLRAWRGRRAWGLAFGLVLGAPEALGLGREAGRHATATGAAGWHTAVRTGSAALALARAGDPRQPIPESSAGAASEDQVVGILNACLSAKSADRRQGGSGWALTVTP